MASRRFIRHFVIYAKPFGIVAAAWDAYSNSRKSPETRKAGEGFADPNYNISVDWLAARDAIHEAQER